MLEKYQQFPFWQKLIAIIVILAIIGFLYHNYVYKEKVSKIASMEKELNSLIVENTEARKMENELPNLERKIQQLEFNLEHLKEILPTDSEIERFLAGLYQTALKNNLRVPVYQKQPDADYEEFLIKVPMKYEANGKYNDLRRFYEALAQSTRIVNILNLDLKLEKKGGIVAKFELTTFRFKPELDDEAQPEDTAGN